MSVKHSPRKTSRSVTSESLDSAKQILDGKLDLSKIEPFEAPSYLQGLQALRHRAMIENNKRKMQKCDSLIIEVNNIINSAKDSMSVKSASSKGFNCSSKSSVSSFQINQVEITDDEMDQINSIIQALLNGSEIDFIDSSSIPKLELILKIRKDKAIEDSDYQSAKILEKNIQSLSKYRRKAKIPSPVKRKEFLEERETRLNLLYNQLKTLKDNLAEEKDRISIDREESLNTLFSQNEKEVNELIEERSNIMMGVGFMPSKKLRELRQQQKNLAKMSLFDEASELKKIAEDLEMQERREFDRKNLKNFEIKEKEQRKKQKARIQASQDFWQNLLERAENRFIPKIKVIQNEIDSIIAKIEEISGKKYDKTKSESTLEFSGLSFNENDQSNLKLNDDIGNNNVYNYNDMNYNDMNYNHDNYNNRNESNDVDNDDDIFGNDIKSDDDNNE